MNQNVYKIEINCFSIKKHKLLDCPFSKKAILRLSWSDYLFFSNSLWVGTMTKLAQYEINSDHLAGFPYLVTQSFTVASDMSASRIPLKEA